MPNSTEAATRAIDACLADPNDSNRLQLARLLLQAPDPLRSAAAGALVDRLVDHHAQLQALTSPPLRMGVVGDSGFYSLNGSAPLVLVRALPSGAAALCTVAPTIDLEIGDLVVLSSNGGSVIDRIGPYSGCDIGRLERVHSAGAELVLTSVNGEELVVAAACGLRGDPDLKPGARVRFSRRAEIATAVDAPSDERSALLAGKIPDLTWHDFGGSPHVKRRLADLVDLMLTPDERLAAYGLERRFLVMFHGRPGTGKSYAAAIMVSELRRRLGSDNVAYVIVNAADMLDPLVGVAEANIRACFNFVRSKAEEGLYTVMLYDEFEALYHTRGTSLSSTIVENTLTPTLLSELDGIVPLRNFMMIAITNRPDLVDSAVTRNLRLGRPVVFGAPDWAGTEHIFRIHLAKKELAAGADVEGLAERAAAAVFAPQHDGGSPPVAVVRLVDGSREVVRRSDLVSGALVSDVCGRAAERAMLREERGGPPGIRLSDVADTLDEVYDSILTLCTPENLSDQLGWPLDKARKAVAIEPPPASAARSPRMAVAG